MLLTAGLTVWGYARGAWIAPALALAGYVGMRGVMWGLPQTWHEVAACTLWLLVATAMMYHRAYVPGFFYALSGLCYPVFLLIGFPMEYMGVSLIFAEGFAALALLGIGGGIYGMADRSASDRDRLLHRGEAVAVGMAVGSARDTAAFSNGRKVI
jgi:hypothetical protein